MSAASGVRRVHVDLFSGIGGFALACSWCGIETVQFVEIDKRCRDFLSKAWPGVPIHGDIRTFDGRVYAGRTFLLTGGVPCQPASQAGRRRGAEDDRWLWPEALRVLSEVRPVWTLFENPPGIGDVGLAGIHSAMETHGYEVQVFGVPACAVGAPHRRMRYWIVGRVDEGRVGDVGDPDREGRDSWFPPSASAGHRSPAQPDARIGVLAEDGRRSHWDSSVLVPCADGKLRRAPDDSFGLVDGLHRSLLGALGNSIVPQVAERIIRAMIEAEDAHE